MKKIVNTENAPKAIGPYNQAVIDKKSGLLFSAMQIGLDPKTSEFAGPGIEEQAHQVFKNLSSILIEAGGSLDNVVKVNLYFVNLGQFAVVNEIYAEYFSGNFPARAAMEVSDLPKGAIIAADLIAIL